MSKLVRPARSRKCLKIIEAIYPRFLQGVPQNRVDFQNFSTHSTKKKRVDFADPFEPVKKMGNSGHFELVKNL